VLRPLFVVLMLTLAVILLTTAILLALTSPT
jgi:hypothetical protein